MGRSTKRTWILFRVILHFKDRLETNMKINELTGLYVVKNIKENFTILVVALDC